MIKYEKIYNSGNSIIEIDLTKLSSNYKELCFLSTPGKTSAVLKADAYGCGIKKISKALYNEGCRKFFVAKIDEAIELRAILSHDDVEIAVLDGLLYKKAEYWSNYKILPVCNSVDQLNFAIYENLKYILNSDTGMNRLGLTSNETISLITSKKIIESENLNLIMSHLACSDNLESKKNDAQIDEFNKIQKYFPNTPKSLANSHGIWLGKKALYDLTRPGIALYGYTNFTNNKIKPVVRLLAPILQIRNPEIGETVGYDATYKINKKTIIGILGIGYADGLMRCIGNRKNLYLGKYKIPIVGRVSMDTLTVDFSQIPSSILSNARFIPLIDDNYEVSDLAKDCNTISYEILTSFSKRIQRVYIN